MTPEKDAQLCQKYPKIFKPDSFYSECDDGWYDLIDTLSKNVQSEIDHVIDQQKRDLERGTIKPEDVIDEEDFQVVAVQVKSKFGGLRFYATGGNDITRGMITMAESISYMTCEGCGQKATLKKNSWWRTTCDPCEASWFKRTIR